MQMIHDLLSERSTFSDWSEGVNASGYDIRAKCPTMECDAALCNVVRWFSDPDTLLELCITPN